MNYLFKKVHLFPDCCYLKKATRVSLTDRISDEATGATIDGLVAGDKYGLVVKSAASLSALLKSDFNNDLSAFFDWLWTFGANDIDTSQAVDVERLDHGGEATRLQLHAGPADYWFILACWYRHLYPTQPAATVLRLLRAVRQRLEFHFSLPYNPQMFMTPADHTAVKATVAYFDAHIRDNEAYIAEIPQLALSVDRNTVLEEAPIEMHLAGWLLDRQNYPYREVLGEKLRLMVQKTHLSFLYDTVLLVHATLTVLPGFDLRTDTLDTWVARNPDYRYLNDRQLKNDDPGYFFSQYDPAVVRRCDYALREALGYKNPEQVLATTHYLEPALSLDAIIDAELEHGAFAKHNLGRWSYSLAINNVLLQLVLRAARQQDYATLRTFALC